MTNDRLCRKSSQRVCFSTQFFRNGVYNVKTLQMLQSFVITFSGMQQKIPCQWFYSARLFFFLHKLKSKELGTFFYQYWYLCVTFHSILKLYKSCTCIIKTTHFFFGNCFIYMNQKKQFNFEFNKKPYLNFQLSTASS